MSARDWVEKDYYRELGVAKDASADDIKKAYRKIARENHPDAKPGDAKAEARFKAAGEAYGVLSDTEKRQQYDEARTLFSGGRFGGFGGGRGAGAGAGGTGFSGGFDVGDLFGGRGGAQPGAGGLGDLLPTDPDDDRLVVAAPIVDGADEADEADDEGSSDDELEGSSPIA